MTERPWWAQLGPYVPEVTDPRIVRGTTGDPPGRKVSWEGPGYVRPWHPTEQELARTGGSEILRGLAGVAAAAQPIVQLLDSKFPLPQALSLAVGVGPHTVPVRFILDLGIGRGRFRFEVTNFVALAVNDLRTFSIAARSVAVSAQYTAAPAADEETQAFAGVGFFSAGANGPPPV